MSEGNGKELPKGWASATLSDLVGYDGIFCDGDWVESEDQDPAGDVRLVQLADVGDGAYRDRSHRFLTSAKAKELNCTFMKPGDVLIARMPDPLGRACIFPGDVKPSVTVVDICIVRPETPVSKSWLMHQLNTPQMRRMVAKLQSGTTRKRISRANLATISFPIPPLSEQTRIADTLDELLSDLDAGVAALEGVRAKLKHYRAAVLKAAVEGSLTADWRAQHPATEPAAALLTRILAERRRRWEETQLQKFKDSGKPPPKSWQAKYQEPTAPDTTHLPKLPDGWCWATVDQCTALMQYGSSAKTDSSAVGIPVLRMGNIKSDGSLDLQELKYLPAAHDEFPALLLEAGDLLFNRTNSAELVGKTGFYRGVPSPSSYASYLIRLRMLPGVEGRIVSNFINSAFGRAWIKTVVTQVVGQANVNGTKLAALAFPLPSFAEQSTIVELVEDQLSVIDHLEADLEAKLKSAQALRQSILCDAFAGKLVPQDPNDEPASELLKRIAANRAALARAAKAAKPAKPKRKVPAR